MMVVKNSSTLSAWSAEYFSHYNELLGPFVFKGEESNMHLLSFFDAFTNINNTEPFQRADAKIKKLATFHNNLLFKETRLLWLSNALKMCFKNEPGAKRPKVGEKWRNCMWNNGEHMVVCLS